MRTAARHVPAHESGHYTRAKGFAEGAGAPMLESAAADSAIQADWDKRNVLRVPCTLTVPAH